MDTPFMILWFLFSCLAACQSQHAGCQPGGYWLRANSVPGLQGLVSSSWDAGHISIAQTLSSHWPFILSSLLTRKSLSQHCRESICSFFTSLTFFFFFKLIRTFPGLIYQGFNLPGIVVLSFNITHPGNVWDNVSLNHYYSLNNNSYGDDKNNKLRLSSSEKHELGATCLQEMVGEGS